MAEKHPHYWRIKCAFKQFWLNQIENERQLAATLTAAGLTPGHYQWNDDEQSIMPSDTVPDAAGPPPTFSWGPPYSEPSNRPIVAGPRRPQ